MFSDNGVEMGWLLPTIRKHEVSRDPLASAEEIHAIFEAQCDDLFGIAFIITGERAQARQCLVDASGLAEYGGEIFRDWLLSWSRYVTARTAAVRIRDVAERSAQRYLTTTCGHANHEVLSDEQLAFFRHLDPEHVIQSLDPLVRAVLVLRGCLRASIADCGLLLQVSRRCITPAYCIGLTWLNEEMQEHGLHEDIVPSLGVSHA